MKDGKEFLEYCGTLLGATVLHPREHLVFLVSALLANDQGEGITREDLCNYANVSKKHILEFLSVLEEKGLLDLTVNIRLVTPENPAHGDTNPADGDKNPADGDKNPADGDKNPADGDKNPADGDKNPADGDFLGKNGDSDGTHKGTLISPPSLSLSNSLTHNPPIIPPKDSISFPACTRTHEDFFGIFWKTYPRKVAKQRVKQKLYSLLKNGKPGLQEQILSGLQRAICYWAKTEISAEFIPHPLTWLNQGRWEDEMEVQLPEVKKETFSAEEERFLNAYGRIAWDDEIEDFKRYFAMALEEVESLDHLVECAKIYVEELVLANQTSMQRKPAYWLGDKAYRAYIERASSRLKRKPAVKATAKTEDKDLPF